jgi:excisionase family DNA binding protein
MEKVTLSIKEAVKYAGIHEEKIRQLVHTEDFPCFKNGNKWLINRELLDEWLKKISIEHRQL